MVHTTHYKTRCYIVSAGFLGPQNLLRSRYYLILAKDLGYVDTLAGPMADIEEVSRLLGRYSSAILNADS
jgi:hypothetical protein